MTKWSLYNYLESMNFRLVEKEESKSFDDFYDVFDNSVIQIRFSQDRSIEVIEIRKKAEDEIWYDLPLIMILSGNKIELNKEVKINICYDFLKNKLYKINSLFSDSEYRDTKIILEQLQLRRAKLLFPKWL